MVEPMYEGSCDCRFADQNDSRAFRTREPGRGRKREEENSNAYFDDFLVNRGRNRVAMRLETFEVKSDRFTYVVQSLRAGCSLRYAAWKRRNLRDVEPILVTLNHHPELHSI